MPATIISPANAEHYTWGGPHAADCDAWYLLRTADLHILEELMPPGTSEPPHHHVSARQFFYVLAGELTLEIEGFSHSVDPGRGIEIAPGSTHQAINCGSEDARFLVISQPPGHGDRIDA